MRAVAILATAASLTALAASSAAAPDAPRQPRILVFTKTTGFRHSSIPVAVQAVRELGARAGLTVDATEDVALFTPRNLARYEAVVFLLTTGNSLNAAQQRAFERFIQAGGGFAGVHSATDTEYAWDWYGGLVAARFRNHPHIQQATIRVSDRRHPSTAGIPSAWGRSDEWYNFARAPGRGVRILARLDETTYTPGDGAMGSNHPIAWSHTYRGGRAWYTGGGHTEQSYAEPLFRRHLLGGIRYAAGLSPPRIVSVSTSVRARRVSVVVRYRTCRPCAGRVVVRRSSARISFSGGVGRARTAALPRGRVQLSVVLTDPMTGLEHVVRRAVRIS